MNLQPVNGGIQAGKYKEPTDCTATFNKMFRIIQGAILAIRVLQSGSCDHSKIESLNNYQVQGNYLKIVNSYTPRFFIIASILASICWLVSA